MSTTPPLEQPRWYRSLRHGAVERPADVEWLRRMLTLHGVQPRILVLAAVASCAVLLLAITHTWRLWALGLVILLTLAPVFGLQLAQIYRHHRWLVVFYLLVVTQVGHFVEHTVQVAQIHVLGLHGGHAHGVFGALDIEWVHFLWNTWIAIALLLLLRSFRTNPWLWLTLLVAGWHELEHSYIIRDYLTTGVAGTAGLLSNGGAIGGGLPLIRPDLHFLYNLVETTLLLVAYIYQLRRLCSSHS